MFQATNPIIPSRSEGHARAAVEAAIEHMIALLDTIDGDCDLEDDDPSFDPCDLGEDEGTCGVDLPIYRLDQSVGPTNFERAYRRWQLSDRPSSSRIDRTRAHELALMKRA